MNGVWRPALPKRCQTTHAACLLLLESLDKYISNCLVTDTVAYIRPKLIPTNGATLYWQYYAYHNKLLSSSTFKSDSLIYSQECHTRTNTFTARKHLHTTFILKT